MVIRNRKPAQRPSYQFLWEGKFVTWRHRDSNGEGLVLEANIYEDEQGRTVMLRVARSDGYIQPGVRVDWVTESRPHA